MKLSYVEIVLLRTILNLSGEMEPRQDGQPGEVYSSRKLNGQESSQRRHFITNTKDVFDLVSNKLKELNDELALLRKAKDEEYTKENPLVLDGLSDDEKTSKKKEYTEEKNRFINTNKEITDFIKKSNDDFKSLSEEEHDIEIREETKKLLNKYVDEWGEKVGFIQSEDELVSKIEEKLK